MTDLPLTHLTLPINGFRMHVVTAGAGKPLYLLHGYPQSWYMWRKLAPMLARNYRLVMPDLRGYGDSEKPPHGYDKRTMAADLRALAGVLGDTRFALIGHDRGARVAHRYALDHADTLAAVAVLDILPTRTLFDTLNKDSALSTWHWLFLPQVNLAERLISAEPEAVLRHFFRDWCGELTAIEEAAVQEYLRVFRLPGTIRATCLDYLAGSSTDLEHDAADEKARVQVPLLALWGSLSKLTKRDVLAAWKEKAVNVRGRAIEGSGHFIPEEQPEILARHLLEFLEAEY